MPLNHSRSDKARQDNIKTEIDSGKPIKQAVAIGYAVQRDAMDDHHEKAKIERDEHEIGKYGR